MTPADELDVTDHAVEQMAKRTPPTVADAAGMASVDEIDVRISWDRGEAVGRHEYSADEVRHDRKRGLLLLRWGDRIDTVIHEATVLGVADIGVSQRQ